MTALLFFRLNILIPIFVGGNYREILFTCIEHLMAKHNNNYNKTAIKITYANRIRVREKYNSYSAYSRLQQILHYCPWERHFYSFICIKYFHDSITQWVSANYLSSFVLPSFFTSFHFFLRQDLLYPKLTCNSVCSQWWLWTPILPASTSCQYVHLWATVLTMWCLRWNLGRHGYTKNFTDWAACLEPQRLSFPSLWS